MIDLDRGVTAKKHSGKDVRIYMVKSEPGKYYNVAGERVPIQDAIDAGFDVKRHAIEAKRAELIVEAKKKADEMLALAMKEIAEEEAAMTPPVEYDLVMEDADAAEVYDLPALSKQPDKEEKD